MAILQCVLKTFIEDDAVLFCGRNPYSSAQIGHALAPIEGEIDQCGVKMETRCHPET